MSSHESTGFKKRAVYAFRGEGRTAELADADMVALMEKVVKAYKKGRRVVDEVNFAILYEDDPGGGPGNIRVADLVEYDRTDHD